MTGTMRTIQIVLPQLVGASMDQWRADELAPGLLTDDADANANHVGYHLNDGNKRSAAMEDCFEDGVKRTIGETRGGEN